MKIIQKAEVKRNIPHFRSFEREGGKSGFLFPCSENGVLQFSKLHPDALQAYQQCMRKELDVIDKGIKCFVNKYIVPAKGECGCGEVLELPYVTNQCPNCGVRYNWLGQMVMFNIMPSTNINEL